uniref:Uncharacterized protein n=1 Tax=Anguilla anguilla TaxID=7936 RepID=A0A0E9R489_ANGAN
MKITKGLTRYKRELYHGFSLPLLHKMRQQARQNPSDPRLI